MLGGVLFFCIGIVRGATVYQNMYDTECIVSNKYKNRITELTTELKAEKKKNK